MKTWKSVLFFEIPSVNSVRSTKSVFVWIYLYTWQQCVHLLFTLWQHTILHFFISFSLLIPFSRQLIVKKFSSNQTTNNEQCVDSCFCGLIYHSCRRKSGLICKEDPPPIPFSPVHMTASKRRALSLVFHNEYWGLCWFTVMWATFARWATNCLRIHSSGVIISILSIYHKYWKYQYRKWISKFWEIVCPLTFLYGIQYSTTFILSVLSYNSYFWLILSVFSFNLYFWQCQAPNGIYFSISVQCNISIFGAP